MYLSRQILEELERNLVRTGRANTQQASSLIGQVTFAFSASIVADDYEAMTPEIPVNTRDQHVVTTAIHAGAQLIVTQNLRDFPSEALSPLGIAACDADTFLLELFDVSPETMCRIVHDQAADLRNPPMTVSLVLEFIGELAPRFAHLVQTTLDEHIQP